LLQRLTNRCGPGAWSSSELLGQVNAAFEAAVQRPPGRGILGYETPWVSCDYVNESPGNAIVRGLFFLHPGWTGGQPAQRSTPGRTNEKGPYSWRWPNWPAMWPLLVGGALSHGPSDFSNALRPARFRRISLVADRAKYDGKDSTTRIVTGLHARTDGAWEMLVVFHSTQLGYLSWKSLPVSASDSTNSFVHNRHQTSLAAGGRLVGPLRPATCTTTPHGPGWCCRSWRLGVELLVPVVRQRPRLFSLGYVMGRPGDQRHRQRSHTQR